MNWRPGRRTALLVGAAVVVTVPLAAGLTAYVDHEPSHAGTGVLAERISGEGSSDNRRVPAAKSFSIAVDHQADPLGPGATSKLYLSVDNTSKQDIRVTALSASLVSITKSAANHFPGTCTVQNSGVQVQAWTGPEFNVRQGATVSSAPGYIPITLAASAPDACQDAVFSLTFSGTAVKA